MLGTAAIVYISRTRKMNVDELHKYFATMQIQMDDFKKSKVQHLIGNKAVELFKENFQTESFFGKKWKEVKRRQPPIAKGAAGVRKILTGNTGNLGRSVKYKVLPGKVEVYSDLKYSAAHNYGTTTAGKGHRTTIPQRQFLGKHKILIQSVKKEIDDEINKIIK